MEAVARVVREKQYTHMSSLKKWIRELHSECRKIVWPSRKQTIKNFTVVVAAVIFTGIFVWAADILFGVSVQSLISHFA